MRAVHLDKSTAAARYRSALCGMVAVDTEIDLSRVTCKLCLARNRTGVTEPAKRARKGAAQASDDDDLADMLAPKADAPPRLTGPIWAGSCKGGEYRRCGNCELCLWEREADKWASPEVSAHNREHRLRRPEGSPRWSGLNAALVALAEHEQHERVGPSALGGIIARLERGDVSDGGASRPDDPMLRRAGELVAVRQALERAYPEGGHALLRRGQCMGLLLSRTPGAMPAMPTYERLSEQLGATVGDLRSLVRCGRKLVRGDLEDRGLIPVALGERRRAGMESFAPPVLEGE